MNTSKHSPWSSYTEAVLSILGIVKETVPMSSIDKRRIDEAAELVQAAADIIALEEAAEPDEVEDLDENDDDFIRLH